MSLALSAAVLLVKVLVPLKSSLPLAALKMAPPILPAWLPSKVEPVMVIWSALVMAPPCPIPPSARAVLPLKVLSAISTLPLEPFHTAPPLPALLPSNVEPVMVMVPGIPVLPDSFSTAPPALFGTELPLKVLLVMVTVPSRLKMAPPFSELVLSVKVAFLTSSLALVSLKMAPPAMLSLGVVLKSAVTELPVKVVPSIVREVCPGAA